VEQDLINRSSTSGHTDLISSDKVDGTAVYNRNGDKLGTISHLMIGKRDGRVSYAVMSFGGFLGMGTEEYTLPWDKLDYDVNQGGYVVDVTKEQLEGAPRYERNRDDYDRTYYEGVSGYYGTTTPAW
jgi:sporulation protein YlmC with PRC-barrel domain